MRLHRFFAGKISRTTENNVGTRLEGKIAEGSIVSYAHDSHQWQRVFRFGKGDKVILFDGSGNDYLCEIEEYQGETTLLRILEITPNAVKPKHNVILVSALVKKDTFEWIAEKATELGVSQIIPLVAERSEKKNINTERLVTLVTEASEQSGRGDVPEIRTTIFLEDFLKDKKNVQNIIVFDPTGEKIADQSFTKAIEKSEIELFVCIGPEGGWSPSELASFKKNGVSIFSLGPQILRAETAVIAALSRIVF